MSIKDLIAAVRDVGGYAPTRKGNLSLPLLADAAEKELEEFIAQALTDDSRIADLQAVNDEVAKAHAPLRRSLFKPLQPGIDLEVLRKALAVYAAYRSDEEMTAYAASEYLRSLLTQLDDAKRAGAEHWVQEGEQVSGTLAYHEDAKAVEERHIVDEMMAARPPPETRKASAKGHPASQRSAMDDCARCNHPRGCHTNAVGGPSRCVVGGRLGCCCALFVERNVPPKPEAQTCPDCNGTGKVGGGK